VLGAFTVGDAMHEEYNANSINYNLPMYEDGMDDRDEETHTSEGSEESNFDVGALEEAITALYDCAWYTNLAVYALSMELAIPLQIRCLPSCTPTFYLRRTACQRTTMLLSP
jgi:hypothetical protein